MNDGSPTVYAGHGRSPGDSVIQHLFPSLFFVAIELPFTVAGICNFPPRQGYGIYFGKRPRAKPESRAADCTLFRSFHYLCCAITNIRNDKSKQIKYGLRKIAAGTGGKNNVAALLHYGGCRCTRIRTYSARLHRVYAADRRTGESS